MWLELAPVYKNLMFLTEFFFTSQLQTAITQNYKRYLNSVWTKTLPGSFSIRWQKNCKKA